MQVDRISLTESPLIPESSPLQINELHYIISFKNLKSVFDNGILSHKEAEKYTHEDISLDEAQKIRASKYLPKHLVKTSAKIHDCANFYFNAKNPMLYLRKDQHENICVLRLNPAILKLPNAVVTDRNATCKDTNFSNVTDGLNKLRTDILFAEYWSDRTVEYEENKVRGQFRCAEVLLPFQALHPSYIGGAYVSTRKAYQTFLDIFNNTPPVQPTLHPDFFFLKSNIAPIIPPLNNQLYPILRNFPQKLPEQTLPIKQGQKRKVQNQIQLGKGQKTLDSFFQANKKAKCDSIELPSPSSVTAITSTSTSTTSTIITTRSSNNAVIDLVEIDTPPISPKKTLTPPTSPGKNRPAVIKFVQGNLLESPLQTRVNTVNCVGVMGKGIAKDFKEAFPDMFQDYKDRCEKKLVHLGQPYVYELPNKRLIINFPTKDHWKNPSNIDEIRKGLEVLVSKAQEWGIRSLAIPALGCGNGSLEWEAVKPIMTEYLSKLNIPIDIYTYEKTAPYSP